MANADQIREFVIKGYITPARARGDYVVGVRSGDIHNEMKLSNRLPAVCAALGADEFNEKANVRRIALEGPTNGANALFVYRLK